MLCYGCFADRPAGEGPCPYCGAEPNRDYWDELPPGSVLAGRWQVGYSLGRGGFGITYLAWDLREKTRVAIKELYPYRLAVRETGSTLVHPSQQALETDFARAKEQFRQEIRLLSRFRGRPDVVQISHAFEENGTVYYVMEYLQGGTLKQYMRQAGPLPWQQALNLLEPVFDALCAVHREGIVHRDVSPDNLFLCREGGVKLLDFGAACGQQSQENVDVVLRPGYVPIEQYRSQAKLGPWTDVYALSAILYQLLTGREPPDAVSRCEQDELIPPGELGLDVPHQGERALLRGLAMEIAERWQSVEELRQGLREKIPVPLSARERQQEEVHRRVREEEAQEQERRQREEQSRLLEKQVRRMGRRARRAAALGVADAVLAVALLAAAGLGWSQHRLETERAAVRILTVCGGEPFVTEGKEAADRLSGGNGNSSGNLANGGAATPEGFFGQNGDSCLNLYEGRLYYLPLGEEGVWSTDGRRSVQVLDAWAETLAVNDSGFFYTAQESTGWALFFCPWTEDSAAGAPVRLGSCASGAVPVLLDGMIWFCDETDALCRCDPVNGSMKWDFPGFLGGRLAFAMDGALYGTAARVRELEQEPWLEDIEEIWRYDPATGEYQVLLSLTGEEIRYLNGAAGVLWYVAAGPEGQYLARLRPDETPERLYTAPVLLAPNLMLADGKTWILLWQGEELERVLLDEAGRCWPLAGL